MTILDLFQPATGNTHHHAGIDAPAHGIAPRPPLTAEGMAAYAGVMATFTGTDGDDIVTMTLAQWASFDTIDLGGGTDVLNVLMDEAVDISALGVPSISGVETGNLIGTTTTRGAPVTLSGEQLDAIIIGAGKIDFSADYQAQNKISLTSTSADLNTIADASIVGLDYIDARLATAGVTINLSAQNEGFIVFGSAQADTITSGSGNVTIVGGGGADKIDGGADDDRIVYDGSDISIDGGADNDTLAVSGAATINLSLVDQTPGDTANVTGFENVDAFNSTASVSITGDANANALTGGSGNDTIDGGAGDDYIEGLNGADSIDGGADNDTIVLDRSDVSIAGGTGTDTLIVTGAATINLSLADQTSGDTANVTGFENVDASTLSAALSITGDANANELIGGEGNDTIIGGDGDDTISGGAGTFAWFGSTLSISDDGDDSIDGGAGDDTITFDGSDVSIAGGTGNDTLIVTGAVTINLSLADQTSGDTANVTGFENVDASTSSAAVSLTGDANANRLTGGSGNDTISGGAGADTIDGGAGNDTIKLANGHFAAGESLKGGTGIDTIVLTNATEVDFSTGMFSGLNALTGSSGGDSVTMTVKQWAGFNTIDLGAGTDVLNVKVAGTVDISGLGTPAVLNVETRNLIGSAGNDTLTMTATQWKEFATIDLGGGNDTINLANGHFAAGESLTGGTGADTIVLTNATAVDFSTGTLSGLDTLTGSAGNDTVTMTVKQWGGFDAIDLGAGTGVLNTKVAGTKDISEDDIPKTISQVSTGNLTGSGGHDWLTLTGAQLDAILIGTSSKIDLGAGEDFIILTSNSADISNLNAHGDDKIAGVEHIYCGKATTGVSISLSNQTEDFVLGGSDLADTITGGHGADGISGFYGNDILNGREGDDTLEGWAGDDTLNGGAGNDTISGGEGTDTFVFNTALNKDSNIDRIISFGLLENDTIQLENSVFTKLAAGALSGSAFYIGTAAHDADDRIIYNDTTGALSYDADGKGGSAAVQFATLAEGLALNKADFMVV